MTHALIEPPPEFKAYPAYLREREINRKLYDTLDRALVLLECECGRREKRGENVTGTREFIKRARAESVL